MRQSIATTAHTEGLPTSLGVHQRFADAWLTCLAHVAHHGVPATDDGVRIREVLNVSLAARTCDRAELVAAGADEQRIDLMERKYGELRPVAPYQISYGARFRDYAGVDRVRLVVERLRVKRETKQATMVFHAPADHELPCLSLLDFKVRDDAVHASAVYRSQNVFASQPGNGVAIRAIQQEVAHLLAARVGVLTFHILSAHIYADDFHETNLVLDRQEKRRRATGTARRGA